MLVSKTGPIHSVDGVTMKDYEFMNASQQNAVFGVYERHVAATTEPDLNVLKDFGDFTKQFFDWLWDNGFKQTLLDDWRNAQYTPITWIQNKEDFSNDKKNKYIIQMCRDMLKLKDQHVNMVNSFTTMVKGGEVYTMTQD